LNHHKNLKLLQEDHLSLGSVATYMIAKQKLSNMGVLLFTIFV